MAGLFNFPHNDRERDFENLPPLVPEGSSVEERDRIIADIVEVWSTPLPVMSELESGGLPSNGVTLDRVNLYDAERGEAINLGDLLKQVQDRIVDLSREDQKRCVITLRGCRIESCKVKELEMLCSLKIFACYFGDGVYFEEVSFFNQTYFERGRFGYGTFFRRSSFGDQSSFKDASFGDRVDFSGVSFKEGADFGRAKFGIWAIFANASFGEGAVFWQAKFGEHLVFVNASFGDRAVFKEASFDDHAIFWQARFGDNASFQKSSFGDAASFAGAKFGEGADFWRASLRDTEFNHVDAIGINFSKATFGLSSDMKSNLSRWKKFFISLKVWVIRLTRQYDWARVRSISELQILTRVSYLALIIVPLLAGTWPAVRVMINRYNNAITEASAQFEEASQSLDAVTSRLAPSAPEAASESEDDTSATDVSQVVKKLKRIDAQAEEWIDKYGPKTIQRTDLPDVFAISFFAALFVVFGHLVYQTSSPELIRPRSRRQYMRESLESFDEKSRDYDLRLRKAMQRLKDAQGRMPWNRHVNFVHRDGDTLWVPSEMERFKHRPRKKQPKPIGGDQPEKQIDVSTALTTNEENFSTLMRITIEEGAKAEYDVEARGNLQRAWVSGIFYLIAAFLIAWIVFSQSANIGDAAGWWDSPLIEHTSSQ